jgi:hypothetical protein
VYRLKNLDFLSDHVNYVNILFSVCLHKHRWKNFDFESKRLQNLAKGLSPAYLRLGGTDADFAIFKEKCDESDLQKNR